MIISLRHHKAGIADASEDHVLNRMMTAEFSDIRRCKPRSVVAKRVFADATIGTICGNSIR